MLQRQTPTRALKLLGLRGGTGLFLAGLKVARPAEGVPGMTAILLVEDDAVSRRSVAQFFRLSGYEVCEAEEGETALRLLSHGDFEVVISDFNLPGELTGIDILDHARAMRGSITRLLITGHGSDDLRKRAELLGAVYMEKPVQLEALEMTVEQRAKT